MRCLMVSSSTPTVWQIESSLYEDFIGAYTDLGQPFVRYRMRENAPKGSRIGEDMCALHVEASAHPPPLFRE